MINVLFVCLGNICRSPLAEGIFEKAVEKNNLDNEIHCDSAGTSGWHVGEEPDRRSIQVATAHNIRLNHLGRKINNEDVENFDYIIAMDKQNKRDIMMLPAMKKNGGANLYLMRDFDDIDNGSDVPDPYYGGPDGFELVFEMLERSCNNLLYKIKQDQKL